MQYASRFGISAAVLILPFLVVCGARAEEDTYYAVPIDSLTIIDGKLPTKHAAENYRFSSFRQLLRPYAVLDGPGDVFAFGFLNRWDPTPANNFIYIHTPDRREVTGRLYLENEEATGMVEVKFKISPKEAKPESKDPFYRRMEEYYETLLSEGAPGAAWFRHQAREAHKALGGKDDNNNNQRFTPRPSNLDDTYALFTGNQALAENLQLEKALPAGAAQKDEGEIDVKTLRGITVAPMDWKDRIKDKNPALDPLAAAIPADQHAIFFHSFEAMIALADEAERDGTPVLQFAETRSEDAGTRYRYERQLGLSLTGLGRMLGPRLVKSIAVTGSDPYLRGGSDVAVLFEPKEGEALKSLLTAQINAARQMSADAKEADGKIGSLQYTGVRSPDRTLCSYLAVLSNGFVVMTNSPAQLAQLAAVQDGKAEALSKTPEYIFFRERYKLGAGDESALLVLTDATIRRWCGARWRIADSRRTRAAALLSDLDARNLDKLVAGKIESGAIYGEFPVPDLGDLHLTARGASSSTYGSLSFMTPISELNVDKVTVAEASAYGRWRDSYETNWRGVFDPIALRFSVSPTKLAADLTVMPLIIGTQYRELVQVTKGAKINPDSGDPHDSLARGGMAVNIKSEPIKQLAVQALQFAPQVKIDPFAWVGQSVWYYADNDPFWAEWAAAKDPSDFVWKNLYRLPVGVRVEVANGFQLTAFLVALHAYVDQSAPGMTVWENLKYKDQPYVKVGPSEKTKAQMMNVSVYYRATPDAFLVTLNEGMLKRSIDRELDRDAATKAGKPLPAVGHPVLGNSLVMEADARWLDVMDGIFSNEYQTEMQKRSWSNLPILNEWKHRYPDQDPLKIYQRFFHAKLIDPAGGEYTWNEQWQTMESSVFGSPAQPKKGPPGIAALKGLLHANLGVTFENDGLRAKVEVDREK